MSDPLSNVRNRFHPSASLETKQRQSPSTDSAGGDQLLEASSSARSALEYELPASGAQGGDTKAPPIQDEPPGRHEDMVLDTKHGYSRSTLDTDAHLLRLDRGNRLPPDASPVGIRLPPIQMPGVPHVGPDKIAIPVLGRMLFYGGLLGVAAGPAGAAIGIALAGGLHTIGAGILGGDDARGRAPLGSLIPFIVGTLTLPLEALVSDPQSGATGKVGNMLIAEVATMSTIYLCTKIHKLRE